LSTNASLISLPVMRSTCLMASARVWPSYGLPCNAWTPTTQLLSLVVATLMLRIENLLEVGLKQGKLIG
jgi:hypothetical protein